MVGAGGRDVQEERRAKCGPEPVYQAGRRASGIVSRAAHDRGGHGGRNPTSCGTALKDDDNQRLLQAIGAQNDRGSVRRILHEPGVEPVNYRTEGLALRSSSACYEFMNGTT